MTSKNQLVQRYTAELAAHPLRTKAVTAGVLSFLQEIIASHIAGVPSAPLKAATANSSVSNLLNALIALKVDLRAVKMAAYGFFVSAPLGHVLVGRLQSTLAGRRLAQVLASNLIVAPIQTVVYLACMAVIGGAKSVGEVKQTIKSGFMAVMRITWMTSPIATVFAQKYVPQELWVPFFNLISFVLGTYFNAKVKTLKLRAEKAKKDREAKGE